MVKVWSEMELKISVNRAKAAFRSENYYIANEHHNDGPNHFKTLSKESHTLGNKQGFLESNLDLYRLR